MKNTVVILVCTICVLWSCSSAKKLETTAPFALGETYAQKWTIEDEPEKKGYEVVITLLSLDNDKAVLKNLYHKGKMAPLEIKLTELGNVAIAEFGPEFTEKEPASVNSAPPADGPETMADEVFPFVLTETQAVISYVNNEKVKYYRIDGIRRNLPVTYATATAKEEH